MDIRLDIPDIRLGCFRDRLLIYLSVKKKEQ